MSNSLASKLNLQFLLIDPQHDFCHPDGQLYVPNAEHDMKRVAQLLRALRPKLSKLHITLDSHHLLDIAHPYWWQDQQGNHPKPFTLITSHAVLDQQWTTSQPDHLSKSLAYLQALEQRARYPHTIWPAHCLLGSLGHTLQTDILQTVQYCEQRYLPVNMILKGLDPWTEHFSAICAEVPDPKQPDTAVNYRLIEQLAEADIIFIAGEAATHCVLNTVLDLVQYLPDKQHIQKLMWLNDGASPVPNPPGSTIFSDQFARSWQQLIDQGMQHCTIAQCMAKYAEV